LADFGGSKREKSSKIKFTTVSAAAAAKISTEKFKMNSVSPLAKIGPRTYDPTRES